MRVLFPIVHTLCSPPFPTVSLLHLSSPSLSSTTSPPSFSSLSVSLPFYLSLSLLSLFHVVLSIESRNSRLSTFHSATPRLSFHFRPGVVFSCFLLCPHSLLHPNPTPAKIIDSFNVIASILLDDIQITTLNHGLKPQFLTCKLCLESLLGQAASGWEQQLWGLSRAAVVVLCHRTSASALGCDVPHPGVQVT